jgi:phosphatidylserine/phosphatidylglycerophosphate/cardiolipin synthase-like enzyme
MTTRLVDAGWAREIAEAFGAKASELRIVSPFIKVGALARLLSAEPKNVSAITRFNLADFAEGVSDISALRHLLESGAIVRGVKNLHAKMYLFGSKRAIVTSANLTEAALDRNH